MVVILSYSYQQISLCSNIDLTKGEYATIKQKSRLKDFIYSIMGMLWTQEVMCTHSITGKASNAFKDKHAKPQLDPEKVKSICGKLIKPYSIVP